MTDLSGYGLGMYFDRKGEPIDMLTWAGHMEDHDYQVVAQHWVRGWMVSTVWVGINHNFIGDGPPVIFETMIFPPGDEIPEGENQWSEQYCDRYSTEAAAHAGHDQALSHVREKLGADSLADIAGPLMAGTSDEQWDGDIEGER